MRFSEIWIEMGSRLPSSAVMTIILSDYECSMDSHSVSVWDYIVILYVLYIYIQ